MYVHLQNILLGSSGRRGVLDPTRRSAGRAASPARSGGPGTDKCDVLARNERWAVRDERGRRDKHLDGGSGTR